MTNFLYAAFFLAVGAGVVRCIAYLVAKRRAASSKAIPRSKVEALSQELGGEHRLSELGAILGRLASAEAWGMIVCLQFAPYGSGRFADMIIEADGVRLNNNAARPDFPDRFCRAAVSKGLRVQDVDTYGGTIEMAGTFRETGDRLAQLVAEILSAHLEEVVKVSVDQ